MVTITVHNEKKNKDTTGVIAGIIQVIGTY